jgi:tetratricopeptide (TPR) repeat protein
VKASKSLRKDLDKANEPVRFKQELTKLATAQHLGMIKNIKALIYFREKHIPKSLKNLYKSEANAIKIPHPSCYYFKSSDENNKNDQAYKNSQHQHPQYYFNNLGVMHIKLEKYSMAILYFSKALKFLDKNANGFANQ